MSIQTAVQIDICMYSMQTLQHTCKHDLRWGTFDWVCCSCQLSEAWFDCAFSTFWTFKHSKRMQFLQLTIHLNST